MATNNSTETTKTSRRRNPASRSNVVPLRLVPPIEKSNHEVVDLLGRILLAAMEGRVVGVVGITEYSNGGSNMFSVGCESTAELTAYRLSAMAEAIAS